MQKDMLEEEEREPDSPEATSPQPAEDPPVGTSDGDPGDPATKAPLSLDQALAEREKALAERADLLEQFRRAQAEFENIRKRLQRDSQEAREYAAMETIRSLLPILDDFERALGTPNLDAEFLKGLNLIHQQILEVFLRAGLSLVELEGKFNPHIHHAVDTVPAKDDEQDQDILAVYQKGYQFKDRLLRPAMVQVAVKE